jgi:hypothetical protein
MRDTYTNANGRKLAFVVRDDVTPNFAPVTAPIAAEKADLLRPFEPLTFRV